MLYRCNAERTEKPAIAGEGGKGEGLDGRGGEREERGEEGQSSVLPVSLPISPPSGCARFPLTPRFLLLLLVGGSGSMFLVRYVSGGLLFLK
jgi:hypothetical protein